MHLATVRICPRCKHTPLAINVGDFLIAARQDALDWVFKEVSKVYELNSSAREDAHETTYLQRQLK